MHNTFAHCLLRNSPAPTYVLGMMLCGVEYPFGQLFWSCSLQLLVHFQLAEHGILQNPFLEVNMTQQQIKHQHVTGNNLILNPKHRTIPATRKEINSIPGEIRTITTIIISPAPFGRSIGAFTAVWLALLSIQSLLLAVML